MTITQYLSYVPVTVTRKNTKLRKCVCVCVCVGGGEGGLLIFIPVNHKVVCSTYCTASVQTAKRNQIIHLNKHMMNIVYVCKNTKNTHINTPTQTNPKQTIQYPAIRSKLYIETFLPNWVTPTCNFCNNMSLIRLILNLDMRLQHHVLTAGTVLIWLSNYPTIRNKLFIETSLRNRVKPTYNFCNNMSLIRTMYLKSGYATPASCPHCTYSINMVIKLSNHQETNCPLKHSCEIG